MAEQHVPRLSISILMHTPHMRTNPYCARLILSVALKGGSMALMVDDLSGFKCVPSASAAWLCAAAQCEWHEDLQDLS